jgi:hypothetical protein
MSQRQESATFLGLVTGLHPTSPRWRDGMADQVSNLRLGADDILCRRPGLAAYITVPCPTVEAPKPILNFWPVRFEESATPANNKDYIIAHVGDGDGDDDGKLYYWDLTTPATAWTEITTAGAASLAVADDEPGTAFVYNGIFYYSDSAKQYGVDSSFLLAFTPGLAPPAVPTSAAQASDTGSRIQRGDAYYVSTIINKRRFVESLPGATLASSMAADRTCKVTVTPAAAGNVYRSLRSSALDFVNGDLSHFYFVGDTADGTTVVDKRCDAEIQRQGRLNCRGGRPKICRYMILHQGRAWYAGFDYLLTGSYSGAIYWDARCVEWSSAGRVEEVARQYSFTAESVALLQLPELTPGLFGEARTFLPDEVGGGITGLAGIGSEVLAFTTRQAVSISGGVEPFAQRVVSRDVGLCSHRTLQWCGDYGLAGADVWGPWLYNGKRFEGMSREWLSLSESESAVNLAQLSNSFSVYAAGLCEYWWFVARPGGTSRDRAIVWQADRGCFTQYEFNLGGASVNAACNVSLANAQPVTVLGLSNGYIVKVDESQTLADHSGAAVTVAPRARIRWWFGAQTPQIVKSGIVATVLFQSITADKKVNLRAWACDTIKPGYEESIGFQNAQATDDLYPVARLGPDSQGRFVALDMIIPEGCDAPITAIDLKYKVD